MLTTNQDDASSRISETIGQRGWMTSTDGLADGSVAFLLPIQIMRSGCPARVDYNEGKQFLQVTVQLLDIEGAFPAFLHPGIYKFCNSVTAGMEGVSLTFTEDDGDESVMLSSFGWVSDEANLESILGIILDRLVDVATATIPVLWAFVSQKPVVRVGSDGGVRSVRPSLTATEALAMVRPGQCGRA